jgi:hypothetical protein
MAAGMAAATLTDSAAALGIAAAKPPLVWPGGDVTSAGALLLATSVLTMLGLARAAQQVRAWGAAGARAAWPVRPCVVTRVRWAARQVKLGGSFLGAACFTPALYARARVDARHARTHAQVAEPKSVELATELASGALFAFGLTLTGMVRPAKVRLYVKACACVRAPPRPAQAHAHAHTSALHTHPRHTHTHTHHTHITRTTLCAHRWLAS